MKNHVATAMPLKAIAFSVLICTIVYLGFVIWLADLNSVINILKGISPWLWLAAILTACFSYCLRFIRWNILMIHLGYKIPIFQHFMVYLSAFSLTLTPGKLGETIRSVYLRRWGVAYADSLSVFVVERVLDVVVVAILGAFVITLFPQFFSWLISIIFVGFVLIVLLKTQALKFLSKYIFNGGFARYAAEGSDAMISLTGYKRIISITPITVLAWASHGVTLYFVLKELGYTIPPHIAISIYCLSLLAGVASFIPGGLGATEGAIVALLMVIDVDLNSATSAAILVRGVTLWLAIAIGVVATFYLSKSFSVQRTNPYL
jgi:uncharacterized protein (TIRG00374 family)